MGIFGSDPKAKTSVEVIAAGRAPVKVEGETDWTVEDYLVQANIDADTVTIDGKPAQLKDTVPLMSKRIVAVPNVKGGSV